ncbi:hypothetical protein ANN_06829 [Periplaneta americana]|uniref:Uncharacterized protein n=1 Tax=Periplaneta americana TaxID=6978 RepID=A0ABQ8TEQ0_PERAM|nr:hypothetical protein ANN_06829 [Periplaneta americana]
MSPESTTESYPAFARIGLRKSPGKNLNQIFTVPIQLYILNSFEHKTFVRDRAYLLVFRKEPIRVAKMAPKPLYCPIFTDAA